MIGVVGGREEGCGLVAWERMLGMDLRVLSRGIDGVKVLEGKYSRNGGILWFSTVEYLY